MSQVPTSIKRFDFAAQPSIHRRLVEEISTGRYLSEGRNVVLLGPPGVGKIHLAIALGVRCAQMGHRAYLTNALELARKLSLALAENRLLSEMKNLTRPKLLIAFAQHRLPSHLDGIRQRSLIPVILDEIDYLALDPTQASLLFQVIANRYESHGPHHTHQQQRFHVFANDPILASAALDRLLHRPTILNVRGESFRLKEKRQAGLELNPPSNSQEGAAT